MSDSMSSDKWRVLKLAYADGCYGTYPWYVIPPGLPTPKDLYEAYGIFHDEQFAGWRSHRMALAEALEESQKAYQ